jgi:hypothetical protein
MRSVDPCVDGIAHGESEREGAECDCDHARCPKIQSSVRQMAKSSAPKHVSPPMTVSTLRAVINIDRLSL